MDADQIQFWLVERIAKQLSVETDSISATAPLYGLGLDSLDVAVLSGELETLLDRTLQPSLIEDYPTIQQLARYLALPASPPPGAAGEASN